MAMVHGFFFKTGFGFLSAVRFVSTLFHQSTLKNGGEKNGTPFGKVVLPVPYNIHVISRSGMPAAPVVF